MVKTHKWEDIRRSSSERYEEMKKEAIKDIVTELVEARKVLSWYYDNCPEVGDPMREKARVILSAPIGFVPTE